MPENPMQDELAAIDAIIAASLIGREVASLNDDELLRLCESCGDLSPGSQRALERIGDAPFARRASQDDPPWWLPAQQKEFTRTLDGNDRVLDGTATAAIRKKRAEILERLKARRAADGSSPT